MQELMLSELQFSCAIVLSGEEVVPRFRIKTPEGGMVVFLPLPDDLRERVRRMALVRGYMAWKMATSYVLSAESKLPDGVVALGATRTDYLGVIRPVIRKPLSVGPEQWLTRKQIGEGFPELLPKGATTLDRETIAELTRVFGPNGEFPVHAI